MTKMSAQIDLAQLQGGTECGPSRSIGWRARANELSLSHSLSTGSLEPVSLHHWTAAVPVRCRQVVQVPGASLLRRHPAADLCGRHARAGARRDADVRPVHAADGV